MVKKIDMTLVVFLALMSIILVTNFVYERVLNSEGVLLVVAGTIAVFFGTVVLLKMFIKLKAILHNRFNKKLTILCYCSAVTACVALVCIYYVYHSRSAMIAFILVVSTIVLFACVYAFSNKNLQKAVIVSGLYGEIITIFTLLFIKPQIQNGYYKNLRDTTKLIFREAKALGTTQSLEVADWYKAMWFADRTSIHSITVFEGIVPLLIFLLILLVSAVLTVKILLTILKAFNGLNLAVCITLGGTILYRIIMGTIYALTGYGLPTHLPFVNSSVYGQTLYLDIIAVGILSYYYMLGSSKEKGVVKND